MENNDIKQPLEAVTPNKDGQDDDYVKLPKEEYEKLKDSDTRARAQGSENQRLAALAEVVKDNSKFYKLMATDHKKAEFVASHYGMDVEQMKATLDKYYEENPDKRTAPSEDDLYEKMSAKQDEKEAKKTLNSFIKEKGFTKDSRFGKAFMEEVEDYMDGKKWTEETIDKASSKAYAYIKGLGKFSEELEKVERILPGAGGLSAGARKGGVGVNELTSKRQAYKESHKGSILDYVHAQKKT